MVVIPQACVGTTIKAAKSMSRAIGVGVPRTPTGVGGSALTLVLGLSGNDRAVGVVFGANSSNVGVNWVNLLSGALGEMMNGFLWLRGRLGILFGTRRKLRFFERLRIINRLPDWRWWQVVIKAFGNTTVAATKPISWTIQIRNSWRPTGGHLALTFVLGTLWDLRTTTFGTKCLVLCADREATKEWRQ